MASLSDFLTIAIIANPQSVTRPGFGKPLILAQEAKPSGWAMGQVYAEYSSISGVAVDFPSNTVTYKIAARIFSQQVSPPLVAVGLRTHPSTQIWTLTPVTITAGTKYSGTIDGVAWSYTTVGTLATDCTGLAAVLNTALGTSEASGASTTHVAITAANPGTTHLLAISAAQTPLLTVAQTHNAPGSAGADLTADLNAILIANSTWYCILNATNSKSEVTVIDTFVESAQRLFLAATSDSDVINIVPGSDSSTVAHALLTARRTALLYQDDSGSFGDAGWAGAVLPLVSGSETWAYKAIVGASTTALNETQRSNALAKNCNVYENVAGVNITEFGTVGDGEFIDVVRFRDWLQVNMQADYLQLEIGNAKIPYTDGGIAMIQGTLLARLKLGEEAGGLVKGSSSVSVPLAANVPSGDRASRTLNGVTFASELAGAVHEANVTGALTP